MKFLTLPEIPNSPIFGGTIEDVKEWLKWKGLKEEQLIVEKNFELVVDKEGIGGLEPSKVGLVKFDWKEWPE